MNDKKEKDSVYEKVLEARQNLKFIFFQSTIAALAIMPVFYFGLGNLDIISSGLIFCTISHILNIYLIAKSWIKGKY